MKTLKFIMPILLMLVALNSTGFAQEKKPSGIKVYVEISNFPYLTTITGATLTISGNGAFTEVVQNITLNPDPNIQNTFVLNIDTDNYTGGVLTAKVNYTQIGCIYEGFKSQSGTFIPGNSYTLPITSHSALYCF